MRNQVEAWMPTEQANRSVYITRNPGLVYFSIPKCACSSIKIFIRSIIGESLDSVKANPHLYPLQKELWISIAELGGLEALNNLIGDNGVHAFSVIRNPLDRILSAYLDKFGPSSSDQSVVLFGRQLLSYRASCSANDILTSCRNMSFLEFLKHVSRAESASVMNEHWRPYHNQLFGLAKKGDCRINLYELSNIEDLFAKVSQLYPNGSHPGLDFKFAPHGTNAQTSRDTYYGSLELSTFEEIYVDDLNLFSKVSSIVLD